MPIDDSSVPDPSPQESYTEDYSDIDTDIQALYKRFIAPIESIRSQATRPVIDLASIDFGEISNGVSLRNLILKNIQGVSTSDFPGKVIESRAHAFYRLIGFPVVASDLKTFYNPGFNPFNNALSNIDLTTVLNNIPEDFLSMSGDREDTYQARIEILSKQNIDSCAYCILITGFISKINHLDSNKSGFFDIDPQLNKLDPILPDDFKSVDPVVYENNHILKPFMVDPLIENTVTPQENIIAAPFLSSEGDPEVRKISGSGNSYYRTPLLETIIKVRLATLTEVQQQENEQFINAYTGAAGILNPVDDTTEYIKKILEKSDINISSIKQLTSSLNNPNSKILNIILKLFKTIKNLVKRLNELRVEISELTENITWQPIPKDPVAGPEGGVFQSSIVTSEPITKFEQEFDNLRIAKICSDINSQNGNDLEDLPILETKNDITHSFQEKENYRNNLIESLSNKLRDIEIISGKISGLGLIDILSIYTALFSISNENLISLLDNKAFERFYNNYSSLRIDVVNDRFNNGYVATKTIGEVMSDVESKIFIALDFAQACYRGEVVGTPQGN